MNYKLMNIDDFEMPELAEGLDWYVVFLEIQPDRPKVSVFFEDAERGVDQLAGGGFVRLVLSASSIRVALERAETHIVEMNARMVDCTSVHRVEEIGHLPRSPEDEYALDEGIAHALGQGAVDADDVLHSAIYLYPLEEKEA